jgi:predicted homoserine dehydrogenase-like protein
VIIVDEALERRRLEGRPVRVALAGAGWIGSAIARQLVSGVPGIELVAVAGREGEHAEQVLRAAGVRTVRRVERPEAVADAVARGEVAATGDATLLAKASVVDAIIEATGDIEAGARTTLEAIGAQKHVVLVNAELDATLGPILRARARAAGVVVSYTDGDEPGLIMNLYRYAKSIGYRPVLAGNVKGLLDPYRTPETQREYAASWGQKAKMVTSFADGTKLSLEMTLVANATGFRVARRGMVGHHCAHVNEVPSLYHPAELLDGEGLVDFVLGAEPGVGAFLVAHDDTPERRRMMRYFKMGDGPFYVFYQPWHLPHLELPITVARAVLFHDAAVAPRAGPVCEVVAIAKRDLEAGETLDGIGGFTCYGAIENSATARSDNLLPMTLSQECQLRRSIPRDQAIAFDDVEVPAGRLADSLWAEQFATFPSDFGL